MKIWTYKSASKLIPATTEDKDKIGKLPVGEPILITYKQPRNPKLLAKYWVLMNFAFKHLPEKYDGWWAVVDDFEEEVLKAIGWKKVSKDFHGNETVKAKSISFEKCDEETFQQIYDRALSLIARMIQVEEPELMDELKGFM